MNSQSPDKPKTPSQNLKKILSLHKLEFSDYEKIKEILKREPNMLEIGIFSAMWSEHCSYKSSKKYLKSFPTKATWVLQGPGENAGVIDLGMNLDAQRLVAVFKIESHNHPSFIEPNAGAATGVGGILRDIFTMGAEPIVNLNYICFGDILDSRQKHRHTHLLSGVVQGISHYGNCMGVPMIGGQTIFEPCYNGNILVNAFTLGVTRADSIFYGRASGKGNPIIYVGSKSGRDGLGGAVMSSDSFDSKTKKLRPAVQIGDPFTQRLLLEACLKVFSEHLIVGIQDMGAAGLTSSSFEMASRSGSGLTLHLEKVPMRESNMTPYELMLSESQERMLMCAKKECVDRIKEIFRFYNLECEVIGEVDDSENMKLMWHEEICADIPVKPVVESAPVLDREVRRPAYLDSIKEMVLEIDTQRLHKVQNRFLIEALKRLKLDSKRGLESKGGDIKVLDSKKIDIKAGLNNELVLNAIFKDMLSSIHFADKGWVYSQYDSSIKVSTIKGAGMGDASVISLKNYNSQKAISMSVKCNARYCYLNPKEGAKIAVAQSGRNVALSGAKPLAITNCLNFGSPLNPEVMYQFKESCEGIKEATLILNTPVISGNVSLYNQTGEDAIYPTPSIVSVGVIEDYSNCIASHFVGERTLVCVVGRELNFMSAKSGFKAGFKAVRVSDSKVISRLHSHNLKVESQGKKLEKLKNKNSNNDIKRSLKESGFIESKSVDSKDSTDLGSLDPAYKALKPHTLLDSIKNSHDSAYKIENLSGSLLQKILNNPLSGTLSPIDLESELRLWGFLRECTQIKLLLSAKNIHVGGVALALAKMAVIGKRGVRAFLRLEDVLGVDYPNILNPYKRQIQNMLTRIYKKFDENEFDDFFTLLESSQESGKNMRKTLDSLGNSEKILIHEILRDFLVCSDIENLALFAENHTQIVCEVFPHNLGIIKEVAQTKGLECYCIGVVESKDRESMESKKQKESKIHIADIEISLKEAREMYFEGFDDKIFRS